MLQHWEHVIILKFMFSSAPQTGRNIYIYICEGGLESNFVSDSQRQKLTEHIYLSSAFKSNISAEGS